MPTAADIGMMLSLGLGLNPNDASQLANWDFQKLAMLLVSLNDSEEDLKKQKIIIVILVLLKFD